MCFKTQNINLYVYLMAVPPSLLPSHSEKVLGAMKAERTVKRITFNPTAANPGETLYVSVPKLAENEVIVSGSLALVFKINLKVTGAHANNYLVQNLSLVMCEKIVPITRGSETRVNLRVNPQRRSLKGILLLFINPYAAGTRDTEHYFNPDITKVKVTVNGVPDRVYNVGISGSDMWNELTRYFKPSTKGRPNMTLAKYLTANKFGLWIDLRSMVDTTMHGNAQRLVNTQDGVQLEIKRTASGPGTTNCHIFTISDSQMNIMGRQLESVQY